MSQDSRPLCISELVPGTVVSAGRGLYGHTGMLTDIFIGGERGVISLSPQGRIEEPLSVFARGRTVRSEGYPGKLSPQEVMFRARMCALQPYSWLSHNCEHFVRRCHGVSVVSPQVHGWTIVALLGLFLASSRA